MTGQRPPATSPPTSPANEECTCTTSGSKPASVRRSACPARSCSAGERTPHGRPTTCTASENRAAVSSGVSGRRPWATSTSQPSAAAPSAIVLTTSNSPPPKASATCATRSVRAGESDAEPVVGAVLAIAESPFKAPPAAVRWFLNALHARNLRPGKRTSCVRIAVPPNVRSAMEGQSASLGALSTVRVPASVASAVAGGVAIGVCVRLAWDAGGYFPDAYLTAGAVVFATLAVVLVAYRPHYAVSTLALAGFGTLAALAAWTGLSASWSLAPDDALDAMQRALLYAGLFALGLLAAGSGRYSRQWVWAVLAAVTIVCGAGVLTRLAPDVLAGDPSPPIAGFRLQDPLSYWNAFGAMAATCAVLALGLAADARGRAPARAGAAAVAVLLFVAMYLSLSRGAWLAFFVGLVVLAVMAGERGPLLLTTLAVGVPAVLAVLRLHAYPALVDGPPDQGAGHAYAVQLALFAAAAGALAWALATGRRSPAVQDALRRAGRPVALAVGVLALLFAVAAYVVRAGDLEGWTATRLDDASSRVSREWQDFLRPATFSETGTARLTTAKGTRSDLYRVAFDGFAAHPLQGDGAGSYAIRWTRERRVDEDVRNAHSLELETLSDLGLVGGLLLVGFLGTIAAAAVGQRRRPGALARAQTAAVAAACAVWVAHLAVDWDWQLPAYTGLVLILAAALYPYGRRRGGRRRP